MSPRKRKLSPAEQAAIGDSPVNTSGVGEDPAVKALLSDTFVKGTDVEALNIALALQEIMRGQDSIKAQIENNNQRAADEFQKVQARLAEYDKKAAEYETDRAKFLDEVNKLADKVRLSGEAKDKAIAQGANVFKKALEEARAKAVHSRLLFEEELKHMPTENVVSPGVLEMVNIQGQPTMRLVPETIRLKHRVWVLPPGKIVEVPHAVAEILRQRRTSDEEQEERKAALSAISQDSVLVKKWREIDAKYNTGGEQIPSAS